jgi:hypothetical protein
MLFWIRLYTIRNRLELENVKLQDELFNKFMLLLVIVGDDQGPSSWRRDFGSNYIPVSKTNHYRNTS